uniref:Uncharacterized protein n=1 Tax=Vespula pensylvanica TaxID=30213 RepID=A0A834P7D7_VESPE|nr:hypothetical protein H0235_004367 [Vespula pensylvanica]
MQLPFKRPSTRDLVFAHAFMRNREKKKERMGKIHTGFACAEVDQAMDIVQIVPQCSYVLTNKGRNKPLEAFQFTVLALSLESAYLINRSHHLTDYMDRKRAYRKKTGDEITSLMVIARSSETLQEKKKKKSMEYTVRAKPHKGNFAE